MQCVEEKDDRAEAIRRQVASTTPSLVSLVPQIIIAAEHDITVLLSGETGTGKTFLARSIHECSPRRKERFLVVPCGALSSALIESELFGHARGAFTGADRGKVGKFEAAGQGTILLDEIDAFTLKQQASLLRVVETGEYEPVGSHETRRCAARLIVASNWDLEKAVSEGRFRQDLLYRLSVLAIYLPPLHERVQDIAPLARHMAAEIGQKFHKGAVDISPEALAALKRFPWPGNIRQLENVIQQAVLFSNGPLVLREHLPQPVREGTCAGTVPLKTPAHSWAAKAPQWTGPMESGSLQEALAVDERAIIEKALAENRGNRARTACALGISRVTLYKKMKRHGLSPAKLLEDEKEGCGIRIWTKNAVEARCGEAV